MSSYPSVFLQNELHQIFDKIVRNKSCAIVGVSGVGKTYAIKHILNPAVQFHHFAAVQDDTAIANGNLVNPHTCIFLTVDINTAGRINAETDVTVFIFDIILKEVEQLVNKSLAFQPVRQEIQHILTNSTPQTVVMDAHAAIGKCFDCLPLNQCRVVIILDAIEKLKGKNLDHIFSHLCALPGEFDHQLVYIVPTRFTVAQLLRELRTPSNHREVERFVSSIFNQPCYLNPYQGKDLDMVFETMLKYRKRKHWTYSDEIYQHIKHLSGGHGRFMQILLREDNLNIIDGGSNVKVIASRLLDNPTTRRACERFIDNLTHNEKKILQNASLGNSLYQGVADVAAVIDQLQKKGLLVQERVNIPLLEPLLRTQSDVAS